MVYNTNSVLEEALIYGIMSEEGNMVEITQNFMFLMSVIIYYAFIYNRYKKHGRGIFSGDLFDIIVKNMFLIYLLLLISKVYFPMRFNIVGESKFLYPVFWINPLTSLIKLFERGGVWSLIYNFGGNLILLSPLAVFMCYFFEKKYFDLKRITIFSFGVSLFIECTQVILSFIIPLTSRYFETADIIFNTLGGVVGYYIYYYLKMYIYKKVL